MPYTFLAFIAGAALSLQALVNARLSAGIGGAIWAAAISFFVGGAGLLAVQLATRATWPSMERIAAIPYWVWLGGFLGALYVASVITSVPRLGNTTVFAWVIFGQLAASLQAAPRIQSPSAMMRPLSSASGMNDDGGTMPCRG